MLEPAYQADVVVVGAGVAGLSAAHRLASAGVTTAVLEAAPYVGGRMSTEKVDGFRLDRIGQLLSTAYPELASTPGLDALVLRPFAPGVLLHSDGRHHRAGAQVGRGERKGRTPRRTRPGERSTAGRTAPAARRRLPARAGPSGGPAPGAGGRAAGHGRGPGPAGRRAHPARRHPGRTAAAPPRVARRAGPRGPRAARPHGRRLPASAARRTAVRPGPHHLQPLRRPRAARLRGGPAVRCRRAARRRCRSCSPRTLPPGTVHTGVRVTSVSTTSVTTAEHGEFRCRAVLVATGRAHRGRAAARTAGARLPPGDGRPPHDGRTAADRRRRCSSTPTGAARSRTRR